MVETTSRLLVAPVTTTWRPCKLIQVRAPIHKHRCTDDQKPGETSLASTQDETTSESESDLYCRSVEHKGCYHFDMVDESFGSRQFDAYTRERSDSVSTCSSISLSILAYDDDRTNIPWEHLDGGTFEDLMPRRSSTNCFGVGTLIRDFFHDMTHKGPILADKFDRYMLAAGQAEAQLMD